MNPTQSFRSQLDRITGASTAKALAAGRASAKVAGLTAARSQDTSRAIATAWRQQIETLKKAPESPVLKAGKASSHRRDAPGFTSEE